MCLWYNYINIIYLHTEPKFSVHVTESFLVAGPVAVEIDRAVLSSLEHLHVTNNVRILFTNNFFYCKPMKRNTNKYVTANMNTYMLLLTHIYINSNTNTQ